jgi:adenosylhomocysteine nucleosidase
MKIKLFVAIPSEFPKELCPEGIELIYTGVGKVNAAISAARHLMDLDPASAIVINYGSAGSTIHPVHSLLRCRQFQQADMDARPLAEKGHTPFDELLYPHIERDILVFDPQGILCTTQDTFQQSPVYEVNDMEAYGIAKVCRIRGIDFAAYKFISDSGDPHDWVDNHHLGIGQFSEILRGYAHRSLNLPSVNE